MDYTDIASMTAEAGAKATFSESYDLIKRLGAGSFGTAWLVQKKKAPESKKAPKPAVAKEIPASRSAMVEAITLSRLQHPNVIRYHEQRMEDRKVYIITEHCAGGDLKHLIDRRSEKGKPLTEPEVLSVLAQVLQGLKYIHGKGLLHRDIKPANIFVTASKSIKLGDFGLTKELPKSSPSSPTGKASDTLRVCGTPIYYAPELVANRPYNQKADIWALGCVAMELMTFVHPFRQATKRETFAQIMQNDVVAECSSVFYRADAYSSDLKHIVRRMMLNPEEQERLSAAEILKLPLFAKFVSQQEAEMQRMMEEARAQKQQLSASSSSAAASPNKEKQQQPPRLTSPSDISAPATSFQTPRGLNARSDRNAGSPIGKWRGSLMRHPTEMDSVAEDDEGSVYHHRKQLRSPKRRSLNHNNDDSTPSHSSQTFGDTTLEDADRNPKPPPRHQPPSYAANKMSPRRSTSAADANKQQPFGGYKPMGRSGSLLPTPVMEDIISTCPEPEGEALLGPGTPTLPSGPGPIEPPRREPQQRNNGEQPPKQSTTPEPATGGKQKSPGKKKDRTPPKNASPVKNGERSGTTTPSRQQQQERLLAIEQQQMREAEALEANQNTNNNQKKGEKPREKKHAAKPGTAALPSRAVMLQQLNQMQQSRGTPTNASPINSLGGEMAGGGGTPLRLSSNQASFLSSLPGSPSSPVPSAASKFTSVRPQPLVGQPSVVGLQQTPSNGSFGTRRSESSTPTQSNTPTPTVGLVQPVRNGSGTPTMMTSIRGGQQAQPLQQPLNRPLFGGQPSAGGQQQRFPPLTRNNNGALPQLPQQQQQQNDDDDDDDDDDSDVERPTHRTATLEPEEVLGGAKKGGKRTQQRPSQPTPSVSPPPPPPEPPVPRLPATPRVELSRTEFDIRLTKMVSDATERKTLRRKLHAMSEARTLDEALKHKEELIRWLIEAGVMTEGEAAVLGYLDRQILDNFR